MSEEHIHDLLISIFGELESPANIKLYPFDESDNDEDCALQYDKDYRDDSCDDEFLELLNSHQEPEFPDEMLALILSARIDCSVGDRHRMIRVLLDMGADPTMKNLPNNISAIFCVNLDERSYDLLLERGAALNINDRDSGGWTPIMCTVELNVMRKLVENGADLTMSYRNGLTVLEKFKSLHEDGCEYYEQEFSEIYDYLVSVDAE